MSLPFLSKKAIDLPPIVSVELIQITEKTNIPFAPKAKKIIEKVKEKVVKMKDVKEKVVNVKDMMNLVRHSLNNQFLNHTMNILNSLHHHHTHQFLATHRQSSVLSGGIAYA